jgi:hypothetical protein
MTAIAIGPDADDTRATPPRALVRAAPVAAAPAAAAEPAAAATPAAADADAVAGGGDRGSSGGVPEGRDLARFAAGGGGGVPVDDEGDAPPAPPRALALPSNVCLDVRDATLDDATAAAPVAAIAPVSDAAACGKPMPGASTLVSSMR